MLRARERALIPFPSIDFTFGLAIESIKELGGVSVAFRVELILSIHPLNDIFILKTFNAPIYMLHMKWMKGKEYGLNIVIVSVTNLGISYLKLFLNTHTILI